jgi:hypothetical protein
MPPMMVRIMIIMPRCCVLSAIQVVAMVTRKERKNGGAVKPWAFTAVKPTGGVLEIGVSERLARLTIIENGWKEDGKRGEADVTGEVHQLIKTVRTDTWTLKWDSLTAVSHALISNRVAATSLKLMLPTRSSCPTWRTPLAAATRFSSSVKKRAFCGESGRKKNTTPAITIVGSPSTRNKMRQFSICGCLFDVIP